MNIKIENYTTAVIACMIFFCTATNLISQSDTAANCSVDHVYTVTHKAKWQNLPKIRENLEFWKTLLKEKISTCYSNGLSPSIIDSTTDIALLTGIVVTAILLTVCFDPGLFYDPYHNIKKDFEGVLKENGFSEKDTYYWCLRYFPPRYADHLNAIQFYAKSAIICFGSASLGFFAKTTHSYQSKRKLTECKNIPRQLETIT